MLSVRSKANALGSLQAALEYYELYDQDRDEMVNKIELIEAIICALKKTAADHAGDTAEEWLTWGDERKRQTMGRGKQ